MVMIRFIANEREFKRIYLIANLNEFVKREYERINNEFSEYVNREFKRI